VPSTALPVNLTAAGRLVTDNPDSGHTGTVSITVRVRPGQQERREAPDPGRSSAMKPRIQCVLAP